MMKNATEIQWYMPALYKFSDNADMPITKKYNPPTCIRYDDILPLDIAPVVMIFGIEHGLKDQKLLA